MLKIVYLFYFCLRTAYSSNGIEELYFSKTPQDVDVVQGNSITLPCEVTPDTGIAYYWELNGSRIPNTTRRYQKGSGLHITRVDRERDSGQFTCIAEPVGSSGNAVTSSAATLNIQWIGEASVQLQEPESASYIQRGHDVTLRCHLDASGDVHFEWFRNTERLIKSARLDIKKRKLHIKSVQPSDNGVYRCMAKNEAGLQYSVKNFALAIGGDGEPLIQKIPKNVLVKKGDTALFDCVYQHADVTEWYFKDNRRVESNNRLILHSNGTLQVNDASEEDEGLYTCVGIKGESIEIPQSYSAELKIAYIDNFTEHSFEPTLSTDFKKFAAEGSFFQLTCLEPKSLPVAKKWWLNPHGHTISDSGETRVDDDGRLIIESVKTSDEGKYTCVAENVAGKTERNVDIIVATTPVITSHPISVAVDENQPTALHCEFTSTAKEHGQVRWRKDGKALRADIMEGQGSSHQRVMAYRNGTLAIHAVQPSDRGEYVCEVLVDGFPPLLSMPATVSVIESLKFSPAPVNKKLELSTVARVHCKAQGTPPPIIHWEKDGIPSDQFDSHITDMNGTLQFNLVQTGDNGTYNCIATNSQGTIKASVVVDVVVAPKVSLYPSNMTEAVEGQSIKIECIVQGNPKPTIQWDKNLKLNDLDTTRFTAMPNGTLYIRDVRKEDEDKYGCTAGSSAGLNRKEVQLIVHSKDGNPFGIENDSAVTKAVLITMSVAGAYIILVVGLMVWCRYRRRSRKLPLNDSKTENGDIEHAEVKDGVVGQNNAGSKIELNGIDGHKEGHKSDGAETTHSQSSNHSKRSKSHYDKLALPRENLKDLKLIGRGEFGEVMVGKVSKSVITSAEKRNSQSTTQKANASEDKEVPVLVKCLSNTKDEQILMDFKSEIDMFAKMSHKNVIKLFGLCRETEPHYMIMEHTDWGDLKQFLVATQKGNSPPLTTVQCVATIEQIAMGMEYMSNNRLVHRDLAARNCLVTSTLVVKVGMPKLLRDPYSQEYCKHVNQVIPLRWSPYEAVFEDEYSTKSDIYAFGVVIGEIFSQGELPFPKINDNTFLNKLKEKKLEWKPHQDAPEALQKIQEICLDTDTQNRPLFPQLVKDIEEILKSL